MKFAYRLEGREVKLSLRPRADATMAIVVVDPELGEFTLEGSERLEARDLKLAAAIHPPFWHGGWHRITADQAMSMLAASSPLFRPKTNVIPMPFIVRA